ncbi:unnamed protein product [Ceutorhynchus assimilis]|uniref:Uncharacterized protein n=1 Tax=Ceutorhynchus assimilis TaxID=467358 RepID=A0A9N9MGW7_9CUCU|nr:unnamed protein product [Ceutorhynchus assimilis]
MKYIIPLVVVVIFVFIRFAQCKEVKCSKKSFICQDATSFYECISDEKGNYFNTGVLQSCPPGLMCDDKNEIECEEDISMEFLTDRKLSFKFAAPAGRKHIIDDE